MKYASIASLVLLVLVGGYAVASRMILNPRVVRELREHPDGERARKVMLITLPSGKAIPVNYLRDGQRVYAGADFPWWRELRGGGAEVSVLIRGRSLKGHGRAIEDDPVLRTSVFGRLRPTAPKWAGTLVEVTFEKPR
ncbi:MAG: hypothetical protein JRG96_03765 [Deltaproteobacteria bacterium]|nr:hypothetical protein [Deltaproteobacteria bacterium]MBW2420930.1 hypothetical protein [Deltaproteobacteria bacterium]